MTQHFRTYWLELRLLDVVQISKYDIFNSPNNEQISSLSKLCTLHIIIIAKVTWRLLHSCLYPNWDVFAPSSKAKWGTKKTKSFCIASGTRFFTHTLYSYIWPYFCPEGQSYSLPPMNPGTCRFGLVASAAATVAARRSSSFPAKFMLESEPQRHGTRMRINHSKDDGRKIIINVNFVPRKRDPPSHFACFLGFYEPNLGKR